MAQGYDMDEIQKEIRDLILHSKSKRSTVFEPCNKNNLSEYLTYVQEEMVLYGIKFRFNPYEDLDGSKKTVEAMVRLVNAIWNLIMQHKEISTNADTLKERNYNLQQNNFYLNNLIEKLKSEVEIAQNKCKQTEESKRQMMCKLDLCQKELAKTTSEIKKIKKQMDSKENQLQTQIKKLQRDYSHLQDKSRGQCGIFVSRVENEQCAIEKYKSNEKKYKETIAKLQETNKQLLYEVISLKDDLIASDKSDSE